MNGRIRVAPIALAVVLCALGSSYGSLFYWRVRVRPPVSLRRALEIAERQLGDEANDRYCVRVALYGNPQGAPRPGTWNLFFAARDGSQKHVAIDMAGNSSVTTWNEAVDWSVDAGRRRDLPDVVSRLQRLFDKEKLDVAVELRDDRLTCRYRTRKYQIHRVNANGEFSEQLSEQTGPQSDGFLLTATIVDESRADAEMNAGNAPYWTEFTHAIPTTAKGKVLIAELSCGHDVNDNIQRQIEQALGMDFVRP